MERWGNAADIVDGGGKRGAFELELRKEDGGGIGGGCDKEKEEEWGIIGNFLLFNF